MINSVISNYLIVKELGSGGMGVVYKGRHNNTGKIAAIKKLRDPSNKKLVTRFVGEAEKLGKFDHKNITKFLHFVREDEGYYMIMEYVEGRSFEDFIHKKEFRLTPKSVNKVMVQILDGIQYAHKKNVVHRDLKPGNLLLQNNKEVKIMDFGISKYTENDLDLTSLGARIGTPLYMSPEQVNEDRITIKTDIYSLGVVYFELLAGCKLYNKQQLSKAEVFRKIANEPLPPINEYNKKVPITIQKIISKATEKNPDNRFVDCNAFKQAILDSDKVELQRRAKILQTKNTYLILICSILFILVLTFIYFITNM